MTRINSNFEIYNIYAVILYELKKFDEAIINWKKTIELNKDYFFGYNNLGNVYLKINEIDNAIINYDKAIKIKSDYFEAYHNRGNAYSKLNNIQKALENYNSALAIKYDYLPSIKSRKEIFKKQKNFPQVLSEIDKILIYEPNNLKAFIDKADIYFDSNKLDEALANYKRALEIKSEPSFVLGNFIHTKTRMCEWDNFQNDMSELETKLKKNIKSSPPYPVTTLFDSPELQLKCSELWQQEYGLKHETNLKFNNKKNDKIKLGFFSADFRTHPMGHLMVRMFELHDKKNFELHGFYFGPDLNKNDLLQNRILKCFDSFNDISLLDNNEAVNLSRDKGIDIAIDCMGYTGNNNRFGVFLHGVAPIQVNFLGYPGTSGSKCMDYIVADKTLISADEMNGKVKAALDARQGDTMIMARTDAIATDGFQEALDRMALYHEVGVDILFIEAPTDLSQLRQIPKEMPGPCIINLIDGGATPLLSAAECEDIGYAACAMPVVVNAVVNALNGLGVKHIDMPMTGETVWTAMGRGQS